MEFFSKVFVLCIVVKYYSICVESLLHDRQFSRGILCDTSYKLSQNCMKFEGHTRSRLECAALCTNDFLSTGYSFNGTSCFVHFRCIGIADRCLLEEPGHMYLKKTRSVCLNEGVWYVSLLRCRCSQGWIGQFCEKRAKKCKELYDWGYGNGIKIVYLDLPGSSQEWKVICYRLHEEIRTYVFGNTGAVSFNRTWIEYENGFFNATPSIPNFFIGLRPLHLINKAGLKELVLGASFHNNNLKSALQISRIFQVANDVEIKDSKHFYKIDFKSVDLSANGAIATMLTQEDCMTVAKNSFFSTWDRYLGSGDNNYALTSGTGWWFSTNGAPCNFLGKWCPLVTDMRSQCASVDGISNDLIRNRLRFTQLYFREPF